MLAAQEQRQGEGTSSQRIGRESTGPLLARVEEWGELNHLAEVSHSRDIQGEKELREGGEAARIGDSRVRIEVLGCEGQSEEALANRSSK
jgi:hypothetical protein